MKIILLYNLEEIYFYTAVENLHNFTSTFYNKI